MNIFRSFGGGPGRRKSWPCLAGAILCLCLLSACAVVSKDGEGGPGSFPVDPNAVPSEPILLVPQASGTQKEENERAVIDYSHCSDGYVMVRFKENTEKTLKAQVKCSSGVYVYDITPGEWQVFPLSDGDGSYIVQVCENVSDKKYAVVLKAELSVSLSDPFAPFLRPNQYVDYLNAPETVQKASELTAGRSGTLAKVDAIYQFVVNTMRYDYDKAKTVTSGYLPVLDEFLAVKKGICFDYAALMTAMLRCQGIPCKLVIGYSGDVYHAWISVWSEEEGWMDKLIYFDGKEWKRMDPTYASTGKNSTKTSQYIGDGSNYIEKYAY